MRGEEKVEARRLSHAPFAGFYGNRNRKVNFISTIRREQNSLKISHRIYHYA